MSQQRLSLLLGVVLALCLALPAHAYHIPTVSEGLLNQNGCYLGAYLGGNSYTQGPDSGHETWIKDPAAFNAAAGTTHRMFSRYVSLGNVLNGNENRDGKAAAAWAGEIITKYKAVPVIFLVPWDSSLDLSHKYSDGKTAQQHIDAFADQLKPLTRNGDTIIIVFGHEMESQQVAKDNPAGFISMFQYAANRFHAAGCQMAWCTNINDNPFEADHKIQWWPGKENPYHTITQPGKAYVDWVAQTRYHFYWNANTFSGLKGEYQAHPEQAWYNYFGNTLGFPLMFAETAGQKPAPYVKSEYWDPDPLNKPTQEFSTQWIESLYHADNLKNNYPRIKAVIWFDTYKHNDNGQPEQNYLIPPGTWNPSKGAVEPLSGPRYKTLIGNPYFLGSTGVGDPELPPTASFTATSEPGTGPVTVRFTDESTGMVTSWAWDFGDGATSTEQDPAHTYKRTGRYSVKLTVSNDIGSDSSTSFVLAGSTRAGYSSVTPSPGVTQGILKQTELPPVSYFQMVPKSGNAPLTVGFTDQSRRDPTGWYWDFGDGSDSTDKNPEHTFTEPGTYTVTLNAVNEYGESTSSRRILVG
jgi:PKD repeat protein